MRSVRLKALSSSNNIAVGCELGRLLRINGIGLQTILPGLFMGVGSKLVLPDTDQYAAFGFRRNRDLPLKHMNYEELQEWNRRAEVLRKREEKKSLGHVWPDSASPPGKGEMKTVVLENAEQLHRQYWEIFNFIEWPELEPGDFAEVSIPLERFCLETENFNDDHGMLTGTIKTETRISSERFFVEIESINDDVLTGRVANEIWASDEIKLNNRIQFNRSNIFRLTRREDAKGAAKGEPSVDEDLRARAAKLFEAAVTRYCTTCNDVKTAEKLRAEAREYRAEVLRITTEIDQRILSDRRMRHMR
jgi:hypothetical protein